MQGKSRSQATQASTRLSSFFRFARVSLPRNLSYSILSQGVVSAVNFGAIVLAAHLLQPVALGIYTLIFSLMTFAVGLNQTVSAEVRTISSARLGRTLAERDRRDVIVASLRFGGLISGLGILAILLVSTVNSAIDQWIGVTIAACVITPFWCVVDANRVVVQASHGKGARLAGVDGIMATLALALGSIVVIFGLRSGIWILLAAFIPTILFGAYLCCAALPNRSNLPSSSVFDGRRDQRNLGAEFSVIQGSNQASLAIVAGIVGLAESGAWRATQSIFGPLNVLFTAVRVTSSVALGQDLARTQRSCWRLWARYSTPILVVGFLSVILVYSAASLLGPALLGVNWQTAEEVLLPVCVQYALLCLINVGIMGLRATVATRYSLIARIGQASASIFSILIVALATPTIVAVAWSNVVGLAVGAMLWLALAAISLRSIPEEW